MVPGREQTYFYLWSDSGSGLQERMACGAEKIKKSSMEWDGVGGPKDVREVCITHESLKCLQDPFGVHEEPLLYSVVGALGDAEVLAE